ncbi:MAG: SDR family oxidoreductase [Bacilli bacterium]|nr:SDR family oxidoreductase [Bacilli bacterium]
MNRVIVITGGTSGIGRYLSEKFSETDYVYILSKNIEKIKKVKKEINSDNIIFIKCDITIEKEIIEAFNKIRNQHNYIDVLINNAAYDYMDKIEKYDYVEFDKIVRTNLVGKAFCTKYAISLLKKSNYPSIINIASRLATRPMSDSSAYCCSASAIVMLTKCSALELEKYSIRVNCVSPSLTLTPLTLKSYTKKEIDEVKEKSTRKRLCESQDIYNLISFLISKESDYINGENIDINGGILLK